MKAIKLFFGMFIIGTLFTSCYSDDPIYYDPIQPVSLETLITDYDLWYVDYHRTTGSGDVPFVSKAFTLSFRNGRVYANNNLVDIGYTGNGYGIEIGYYDTFNDDLQIDHVLDGVYDFEVIQVSGDEIRLRDNFENVTYYLEGYNRNTFDYDQIFYENIEYFLQEYVGWEKTFASSTGMLNEFDNENYLAFTPENITTFYSSEDDFGTNIDYVNWDYVGGYEVFDVQGYENLKILTLDYDLGDNEEFELVVLNDGKIELYHVDSNSTYEFTGREFLQYLKTSSTKKGESTVRKEDRKRTKVQRKMKVRKKHLK
ncbi:hypothetical protein [Urechidicola croceus]|uniref:Nicotinic acid mononucleotide adenyltransferase n=1 Tax=Urechidicola croceus TaxID=1850246 RepID=A0A1D8P8Z5_9FLAO|nr:hypothetical protein [Urechidicola croceus]AOW21042.1 hypothetical protein LPB138_10275 [Urechidicola croceus]